MLQVDKSDDEQTDITCTQIQGAEFLATEMSCSQLLQQVMSHSNIDWPVTEEISSFSLHGHLGTYTALLTAPDVTEVKKLFFQLCIYYAIQFSRNNNDKTKFI